MGTVSADKGDAWMIKDLVRKRFIQALDGKSIPNPSAYVNSAEGQQLLGEVRKEVEDFVGFTLEDSLKEDLNESLAHEIEWSSRTAGDEKAKDGVEELGDSNVESVM